MTNDELTEKLRYFANPICHEAADRIEELEGKLKDAQTKYADLIYTVAEKTPGETRHEIAKRRLESFNKQDNQAKGDKCGVLSDE